MYAYCSSPPVVNVATSAVELLSEVYCLLLISTCGHTPLAEQLLSTPYVHRERWGQNRASRGQYTYGLISLRLMGHYMKLAEPSKM